MDRLFSDSPQQWSRLCRIVVVSLALTTLEAAAADTSELDRLREIYFEQIGETTLPVKKQYGRSLIALQKQLVGENALEEALLVKAEIERLKKSIVGDAPPSVPAPPGEEKKSLMVEKEVKTESDDKDRFRWKGDARKDKYEGELVYRLDAGSTEVRMTTMIEDLQDEYPRGFTWRFLYRSEDYKGEGFRIGGNFHKIQIIRSVGTAVRPNGNWIERTQPFPDTKGEDEVEFFIGLHPGEGSVMIKDVEIIPLP